MPVLPPWLLIDYKTPYCMMYKFFLALLLLPGLSYSQVKKTPVKKKKAGQVKTNRKTFWPPRLPETESTVPPPAPPDPAEPVNDDRKAVSLVKAGSLKAALQQASGKRVGLLLFVASGADNALYPPKNTGFGDSTALGDYFEELFTQGSQSYKRNYLVYMASPGELATEKNLHALRYPAYFFLNADGALLGKREGLKADAYEADQLQQELLDAAERKEMLALQQLHRQGRLDSLGLAKLVELTNAYNTSVYANPVTPDQYELLDIFISNYGKGQKADPGLMQLADKVYNDGGYIREIKLPATFAWLLDQYTPGTDTSFKWYAALSNHINGKYTALMAPAEPDAFSGPVTVAPAAGTDSLTAGSNRRAADSVLQQHAVLLKHLGNVQLLNEALKLVQAEYDLIAQNKLPQACINTHLMPLLTWLYDSLLQVNKGMASTSLILREINEKMTAAEIRYVDDYYTDFGHFENGFKKDLALLLNNSSWLVFKADTNDRYLSRLLLWSKASLEVEKNNPYYLDTYAQLLYAGGDKKRAVEYGQKSINALKLDKNFSEEKWMLPFMEKVLAKMKTGAAVPRKDYIPNQQ